MNGINYRPWDDAHPFTQVATLTQNGVDISDPSRLSDGQWTLVCQQANSFPESMRSMLGACSPKLASLFDAAKGKCPQSGHCPDGEPCGVDKLAQKQLAQAKEAMCKSVGILVRSSFP